MDRAGEFVASSAASTVETAPMPTVSAWAFRIGTCPPAGAWLQASVALGFIADRQGSTGQFQGARSIDAVLKELPPRLLLPRHEYEMTHEGGGNRMSTLFTGNGGKALAARQSLVLFWGEQFPLTRADLPKRK